VKGGLLEQLTDEALLEAALADLRQGHEARAASVLLERYQERVYIWCFRMVQDHEWALDLAQESLIKAFRGLESFGGRSAFSSWLFAIARNNCLSALRRPSLLAADAQGALEPPDASPRPDEMLEQKMDEEAVLDLITRELEPLERQAICLRCFEGLPVDEITRILGIDAATGARSVLQRARRRLRAALGHTSRLEPAEGEIAEP
jgi:RNA polymerase sigma-70 factor, ECF subfamily